MFYFLDTACPKRSLLLILLLTITETEDKQIGGDEVATLNSTTGAR